MLRVGLISDTHGLLRPEVVEFLRGSDRIVHAGDIGHRRVLDQLAAIAPLTVVRGNTDSDAWADDLPDTELIRLEDVHLYVLHDLETLDIEPAAAGVNVVVAGHTHRPEVETRDSVLYVNPGSAGPRRFILPIAAAELIIDGGRATARVVQFG